MAGLASFVEGFVGGVDTRHAWDDRKTKLKLDEEDRDWLRKNRDWATSDRQYTVEERQRLRAEQDRVLKEAADERKAAADAWAASQGGGGPEPVAAPAQRSIPGVGPQGVGGDTPLIFGGGVPAMADPVVPGNGQATAPISLPMPQTLPGMGPQGVGGGTPLSFGAGVQAMPNPMTPGMGQAGNIGTAPDGMMGRGQPDPRLAQMAGMRGRGLPESAVPPAATVATAPAAAPGVAAPAAPQTQAPVGQPVADPREAQMSAMRGRSLDVPMPKSFATSQIGQQTAAQNGVSIEDAWRSLDPMDKQSFMQMPENPDGAQPIAANDPSMKSPMGDMSKFVAGALSGAGPAPGAASPLGNPGASSAKPVAAGMAGAPPAPTPDLSSLTGKAPASGAAPAAPAAPAPNTGTKAPAATQQRARAVLGFNSPAVTTPEQATKAINSTVDNYVNKGVPMMVDHYLKTGQFDKAKAMNDWASDEKTKKSIGLWAKGMHAYVTGNETAMLDNFAEYYNSLDMGVTVDRGASRMTRDKDGNVSGVEVTFTDKDGKRQTQHYDGTGDLLQEGIMGMQPDKIFEYLYNQQTAAATAQQKAQALETTVQIAMIRAKQAGTNTDPKRIAAVAEALSTNSFGQFDSLPPEEQVTIILEKLGVEDQAAAIRAGTAPAPLDTQAPAPPVWYPD